MNEYIEREAAYEDFEKCNSVDPKWTPGRVKALIARQKTADVSPVLHGRWDSSGKYRFQKDNSVAVRCTECGCTLTEPEYRSYVWNYCPVCGAKMECGNDG